MRLTERIFSGTTRKFTDLQMDLLLMGLRFEVKTGMHMTAPRKIGGTCYSIAKREFSLKGSKASVLEQLENIVGYVATGPAEVKHGAKICGSGKI